MSGFTNFVSPSHVSGKAWNTTPYLDFRVVSEKKNKKKHFNHLSYKTASKRTANIGYAYV